MGFLVAFIVALIVTPFARRAAMRLHVMDEPGPHKVQREPVPYLGGIAVFAGIAAVIAFSHPAWLIPLAGGTALGIADDVRSLSPRFRLVAQAAVGLLAGLIAPAPGRFGVAVTALLVVVLVNAVNLIDGMDALASVVVAISAIGFVMVGGDAQILAVALCGALVGFLVYNRPPARIYLGDGGSYLLGTALALLAATALHGNGATAVVAVPFLVGLPLVDAALTILRRRLAGRPLMAGDRGHVYDRLAARGWAVQQVVIACMGIQLIAIATGLLVMHSSFAAAAAVAGGAAFVVGVIAWRGGLLDPNVAT